MVLRKGKWALRVKRCRRVCFRRATSSASKRARKSQRSEEHTSELQSQSNLVCRLLLEKKNKKGVPPPQHASHPQPLQVLWRVYFARASGSHQLAAGAG